MEMNKLLRVMAKAKASDLHLQAGSPPMARVSGVLRAMESPPLNREDLDDAMLQIADEPTRANLERERSADFSYLLESVGRFRVNAFYERGFPSLVLRLIPLDIPELDSLNVPSVMKEIALTERGLVLVTGTTGSGKSTTLAGMINHINLNRRHRIVTIEDPIEFLHTSQKSLIAQRELGPDTPTFADALRRALRQDPDAILVGELRDQETMRIALQAADTGHLVFSTVHTTNASQTVQRLIAMFPPNEREMLLMQLAANLEAVISQRLAKTREGSRVPVVEIMRSNSTVSKLLLEGKSSSIPKVIASRDLGMQLFDQHLVDLYRAEQISGTEAVRLATNAEAVAMGMRGLGGADLAGGLTG